MTVLAEAAFPLRSLFNPNGIPSYFGPQRGFGGANPGEWQIATLLVAVICAVVLWRIVARREATGQAIAAFCLLPLLFGCVGTIVQVHEIAIGITISGIGPATSGEESALYAVYSAHFGFYASVLLSLVAGPIYWRRAQPSRATAVGKTALVGALLLVGIAAAAPELEYGLEQVRLWRVIPHIEAHGPDTETADFLEQMGGRVLPSRERLAALSAPYLDGRDPVKACASLQIFRTLRQAMLSTPSNSESERFAAQLDQLVLESFPRWRLFRNSNSYRDISLYLSLLPAADGIPRLKEIATNTPDNGQALICIAWKRDPADMDFLLPFMLAASSDASSLPYLFRNSYGLAAEPYLRRAAQEAPTEHTRRAARRELDNLQFQ